MRAPAALALLALVAPIAPVACVHRIDRKIGTTLNTVDDEAPFLKVHLKSGELYVLSRWRTDDAAHAVIGDGTHLDLDRESLPVTGVKIAWDDVALFETNTIVTSPAVAAMAVVTGLSLAGTVACAINPKACFGSCPTFYAPDASGKLVLQAEGFSDAISPALEHHDLDSLARTTGHGGRFTLRVTNEAYETHVIKQVDLLAVRRPPGGRVFATDDALWAATAVAAPETCRAAEGDCAAQVRALDGVERTSLTDGEDLAARETIDLTFPALAPGSGGEPTAIVIGARQSLVTTFLLYQGLAYLGTTAGAWLAQLERGDPLAHAGGRALGELVGGVEVQVERDGAWVTVGAAIETGPLATDVHLIRLPAGEPGAKVRIRLPKGGWRLDYVARATLASTSPVTPIRMTPTDVRGTLDPTYGRGRTPATALPLVTMPGDAYDLDYEIPAGDDYELFIDSRGYYLEWMRQTWLREEAPLRALHFLLAPAEVLRELAPAYKRFEPEAEAAFWRSRYAHP
jgi:hypothetical protein